MLNVVFANSLSNKVTFPVVNSHFFSLCPHGIIAFTLHVPFSCERFFAFPFSLRSSSSQRHRNTKIFASRSLLILKAIVYYLPSVGKEIRCRIKKIRILPRRGKTPSSYYSQLFILFRPVFVDTGIPLKL